MCRILMRKEDTKMQKNYDFKKVELEMQNFWREAKLYAFDPNSKKPIYSIDTPPPTVNGSLHIGHIFSYTQAEMIARFRRMQGYEVYYPFGFDDNGLPTERLVERVLGIRANEMPRTDFIQACMETTKGYEDDFKTLWLSLGFSCDWSLQYETISAQVQTLSQKSFIDLYKMGKAYQKTSPVLWCTECQTSIAQAELDTHACDTQFYTLKFRCAENANSPLLIATTRPELLGACVSLFVHPDDMRYAELIGKHAYVPLYDTLIPILGEDTVEMEKGTGIVMCATYGDAMDVEWVQKHNLPDRTMIDAKGHITAEDPYLSGLTVIKARQVIIKRLSEADLILESQPLTHQIAIHERCGTATEFIPSTQWYIDILSDKARFLAAADAINWYPAHMKNRYTHWVENLKWDWCVSRQRYFGVPIPVWYCADCGAVVLPDESMLPVNPLATHAQMSCTCGSKTLIPESGVLDTWATSSLTPLIQANFVRVPMSMRTQAHEIIRTWAFYSIVMSLYHTGELPWEDMMICGFVLAKKGEKISKSKNNADQSPPALIEAHSADAIRYWAANAKLGTDTFFSSEDLQISKRFIQKLWNATKFAMLQLQDFQPMRTESNLPVDRWILARLQETTINATKALNQYEVGTARHIIDRFFWSDFCDDYLEVAKERLYQPEKHGYAAQQSGQETLYAVMLGILKLYAPFIPHLTEYLYQNFFMAYEKEVSIHSKQWDTPETYEMQWIAFGEILKTSLNEARRYKSENNLSMKASLPFLEIECPTSMRIHFEASLGDIKACTHAEIIAIKELI